LEIFLLPKTVFPYFREKIQFTFWKIFDIIKKMEGNALMVPVDIFCDWFCNLLSTDYIPFFEVQPI